MDVTKGVVFPQQDELPGFLGIVLRNAFDFNLVL